MAQVTKPIMLDDTGKRIANALEIQNARESLGNTPILTTKEEVMEKDAEGTANNYVNTCNVTAEVFDAIDEIATSVDDATDNTKIAYSVGSTYTEIALTSEVNSVDTDLQNYKTSNNQKWTTQEQKNTNFTNGISETKESLSDIRSEVDVIWKLQNGQTSDTLTQTTYAKSITVPQASVSDDLKMIGGMSRKGRNLFNTVLDTTTQNGVTCTKNADGTYTLNGTATANTYFVVSQPQTANIYANKKLCGCPSGGGDTTYSILVSYYNDGGWKNESRDWGNGLTISSLYNQIELYINVSNGITCNNLVFKPMITTDTTATYDDYEPYTSSLIDGKVSGVVSAKNGTELSNVTIPTALINACPDYGIGINNSCYNYVDWVAKKYHHIVGVADITDVTFTYFESYSMWISDNRTQLNQLGISGYPIFNVELDYTAISLESSDNGSRINSTYNLWVRNGSATKKPTGKCYFVLKNPEVIDLSDVITHDLAKDLELLKVEAGGTIAFKYANDDKYDVAIPSTNQYIRKLNEV